MKAHPLFERADGDTENADRDIEIIQIRAFPKGEKSFMFANQWDPEQLLTPQDLLNAVGEGEFELIGRGGGRVVDRAKISVRRAGNQEQYRDPVPPAAPPAAPPSPAPNGIPMLQVGGMQIPPNVDPTMVLILGMIQAQQASAERNAATQREDSKFYSQQLSTMMIENQRTLAQMVTGLTSALAGRAGGGDGGGAADGFIKGVETMVSLTEGMREGSGKTEAPKTDFGEVVKNIATSLGTIKDLAHIANPSSASVASPVAADAEAVIPPGEPAT